MCLFMHLFMRFWINLFSWLCLHIYCIYRFSYSGRGWRIYTFCPFERYDTALQRYSPNSKRNVFFVARCALSFQCRKNTSSKSYLSLYFFHTYFVFLWRSKSIFKCPSQLVLSLLCRRDRFSFVAKPEQTRPVWLCLALAALLPFAVYVFCCGLFSFLLLWFRTRRGRWGKIKRVRGGEEKKGG